MLTVDQLAGWAEFYAREPWGFHVEDSRHGMLAATIAAAAGAKDVTPEDFMLGPQLEEAREPEPDDLVKKLQKILPPGPPARAPDDESTQ